MLNRTTLSSLLARITPQLTSRFVIKDLPWAAFGIVLLVHVVVLWWVMGVYFGRAQEVSTQPIFVTLVLEEDPSSESSSAASLATSPASSPESSVERSETPSSEVSQPAVGDQEIPADIALDKQARQPQEPSPALKRPQPPARQEKPVSTPPVAPKQTAEPTSSAVTAPSGLQTGAGGLASGETLVSGAPGPRVVTRIEYLGDAPRPVYPSLARSRKQQGKVIVRVLISAQGQISSINVQQSSGFDALDEAAIRAFAPVRFKPYLENGVPLERIADIPIEFLLRN